ncbi:MAG: T9SS type A sorting domain-containing protein, partial [Bacteroidota bacterium]
PIGEFTLPVTLSAFRARVENEEVVISWATSEEVDNDYFIIERSEDGRNFGELATVPGLNSRSGGNYLHIDKEPLSGVSYYRLRQVDIDGTTNYFGPRSVQMDKGDDLQPDVFPNPASNWLTISPISDQLQTIRLIDKQGRIVKQWEQEAFIATNRFDLGGLAPGIYMLQALGLNQTSWSKQIAVGR